MERIERKRRNLLAAGGTALAMTMAGCSSVVLDRIGNGDDGHGDDDSGDDGGAGEVPEDVPEQVHTYLTDNDANLYENSAEDLTGEDSVTIMNGAGDNNVAFDSPAIRITTGTEVTWEWTGLGGSHNVSTTEGDFEFENDEGLIDEEGHTWSRTFEETGNAMYECVAHTAQGQHGAVIVE